jgi:N-acetylglucosaminyl-diphospho-decaprenol L-rhamnosyltransferase
VTQHSPLTSATDQGGGTGLIDIVIVNWNGGHEVIAAAKSAQRFGGNVIVVDNASTDGSPEVVAREVPTASIVRMGHNSGFAAACNAGAAVGSAPYILLLNPDAEIVEGTPALMLEAFERPEHPTIVGPKTVAADGAFQRSVRRLPTTSALILYQLKLWPLARYLPPLRRYLMLDFTGDRPELVEQVIGAAFAMRRDQWIRYSGLDGGYFLLFEEVDLCRRVADDGGCALYWPGVVVRHIGGTSFRRLSHVRLQRIWDASLLRYAERHLGRGATLAIRLTFPLVLAVSAIRDGIDRLIPRSNSRRSPA